MTYTMRGSGLVISISMYIWNAYQNARAKMLRISVSIYPSIPFQSQGWVKCSYA